MKELGDLVLVTCLALPTYTAYSTERSLDLEVYPTPKSEIKR